MNKKEKQPIEIREFYLGKIESFVKEVLSSFHSDLFYEEYDFTFDSSSEANERRYGKNPMRAEYIKKTQAKRKVLGVSALRQNGLPSDYSSERYIHTTVFSFLEELKVKTTISDKKKKGNMSDFLKKH